jgi:hypothetical protein
LDGVDFTKYINTAFNHRKNRLGGSNPYSSRWRSNSGTSFKDCLNHCSTDTECKAFNYYDDSSKCFYFDEATEFSVVHAEEEGARGYKV